MWNNQRAIHRASYTSRSRRLTMTEKMTAAPTGKKNNSFLRALGDLVILGLLLVGAGAGGYFWGIHQQLAPVQNVGTGTPGAIAASGSALPAQKNATATVAKEKANESDSDAPSKTLKTSKDAKVAEQDNSTTTESKNAGAQKYWISSTGADYTGYSITVKVNDNAVDNFFGPGKNVDITRLVKSGDNSVVFEAKELGEQYNKHVGDAKSVLTLQVVSGPHVTDSFKKSDVLISYSRSAAQTDDATATKSFTRE